MSSMDDFRRAEDDHAALWLNSRGPLRVGPAPARVPGTDEIIVRAQAIAVNPIDALGALARRVVLPWLRYPAVLGSDVAGEVVAVGSAVTDFTIGDRVIGYAVGVERSRNSPAEGAFQTHVTLLEQMTSPIPGAMSYAAASVLPLALTTAAAGLFEEDQLSLELPTSADPERNQDVLIFGGATSVGMNAIQLARNAGYRVVATASPENFELLSGLGAAELVDYHDPGMVDQIIRHLSGRSLAGTLAIASGSLRDAIAVNASPNVTGTSRVASAHPTPVTKIRGLIARRRGVHVSAIWGGSPLNTTVGPAIWRTFLPSALADGRFKAAPAPIVVGHGLESIPAALGRLSAGVRAGKIVVTL
jgi:NADPH:quinone reductase-like Zn-dependent oxidoreductase